MGKKGRLYTTGDVADLLGVSRQRAHVIATSKGFPDSYEDFESFSVWRVDDVRAWITEHRPDRVEESEA